MTLLWLFLACADAPLSTLAPPPVDVQLRVSEARIESGASIALEARIWTSDGWSLEPGGISAEGLTVTQTGSDEPVWTGERQVQVLRYDLSGPDGSYVIASDVGHATGPGEQTREVTPSPIFVDIGVDGPSGGDIADFLDAPASPTTPWGRIAVATSLLLVLMGIAIWAWRRRHRAALLPAPSLPADVIARSAWREARKTVQDDYDLATALSMIFREYLSAIGGSSATSRTSREIRMHFEETGMLKVTDRARVQRLLEATDRLKFAREGGGRAFFDALEDDFQAILTATRSVFDSSEEAAEDA